MLNAFDLSGRTIIVTGASRGIGRTTAEVLAAAGANVVAVARTESALQSLVQDILSTGGKALAVRADVNVPEDTEMLVERTTQAFGCVDVLVNNAGESGKHGAMGETSAADWDDLLENNLRSSFLCAKAVFSIMEQQQRGNVINMASISGQNGGQSARVHYAASKGGMIAFTKALARQMAPWGRANNIAPGQIDTGMSRIPEDRLRIVLDRTPLQRLGNPEEIAHGVLYLASDASSYITGHTLAINGGILMD
jgi:3-oxoacyl-[acyl-carrier protein] reductase